MNLEAWHIVVGALTVVLGPSGATWLVLKVKLNGMGDRVQRIDKRTDQMHSQIATHGERLARIETKLEGM